jgi:hypothetical protein
MAYPTTRLGENLKENNILRTRKSKLLALSLFILIIVITSAGTASSLTIITQTASTTTVYLDPPTINGTVIGQEFNVSIMIRDAIEVYSWQAGLLFNNAVLNCTGFEWGEFLEDAADPVLGTFILPGIINNTAGEITPYGCSLVGTNTATGSGRLAYATFEVIASEVSNLHLHCVIVSEKFGDDVRMIAANIIDVFTVVLNTTSHTVVTVSNSTGRETEEQHSGLYDHAFNETREEISFKVDGPYPGWSNVTIPKTLLSVDTLDKLRVIVDDAPLKTEDRTVTSNTTHYSIYFTYSAAIHEIAITSREILSSTISMTLSSTSIDLESNVTISGDIDPVRGNVTVTIQSRKSGVAAWTTLATVKTDSNSHYSYIWTPETAGTYEIKASWAGDPNTEGNESDAQTVTVKGATAGIDPYILAAAAVGVIAIIAIVVYFVKVRKPEEE